MNYPFKRTLIEHLKSVVFVLSYIKSDGVQEKPSYTMCVWNTLTIMKGPSGCSVITRIASRAAVTALLCCSVMTDLLVELTKSSLYNMLGLLQSSNGITFLRGKRRYRKVFNHEHSLSDLLMVVAMGFRGRVHPYGCTSTKCVTFGLMLVFIYLQLTIETTLCSTPLLFCCEKPTNV